MPVMSLDDLISFEMEAKALRRRYPEDETVKSVFKRLETCVKAEFEREEAEARDMDALVRENERLRREIQDQDKQQRAVAAIVRDDMDTLVREKERLERVIEQMGQKRKHRMGHGMPPKKKGKRMTFAQRFPRHPEAKE